MINLTIEECFAYFKQAHCRIGVHLNSVWFADGEYNNRRTIVHYHKDLRLALNMLIVKHKMRELKWELQALKSNQNAND